MDEISENFGGQELYFYSQNILMNYLISRKIPDSQIQQNEMEKIFTDFSILAWIGQSQFLTKEEEIPIVESIKDLHDNMSHKLLYEKTQEILKKIKNLNERQKLKIQILEHLCAIEIKWCLKESLISSSLQEALHEKFKEIVDFINLKPTKNIALMKLERDIKEIKLEAKNSLNVSAVIQKLSRCIFL